MAHAAISGAGVAGVPCAYELRKRLGEEHRVTHYIDLGSAVGGNALPHRIPAARIRSGRASVAQDEAG